jgi:hypothetical protein
VRRQKKTRKCRTFAAALKKKVVTYSFFLFFPSIFLNAFFGRFVTRGVKKHGKFVQNNPSGLITKNVFFFVRFLSFSPSVVWFDFCLSRFWAFRNKGSSKTRLKKSRENLLSSQKK